MWSSQAVQYFLSKRYQVFLLTNILFLLKRSVWNITNGKAFSIPWIIHEYTEQGTNGDFLLVSKQRLKTTPTFALEKQTRLERKQTRFILTLPVAGAVCSMSISGQELTLHNPHNVVTSLSTSVRNSNNSYMVTSVEPTRLPFVRTSTLVLLDVVMCQSIMAPTISEGTRILKGNSSLLIIPL